jgi:cell fate (sporulation/competence/biofilm development) regulator YlbF (YheA/YmcA/DUF963 family)
MSNSAAILKKTQEYIQELSETDEVKEYKKAVREFEEDTEAKKLLTDYQETQKTYMVLRQGKFEGLKEEEKKLRDLNDRMSKNMKIQTLITAQENLQALVGNLAGNISRGIDFPFMEPDKCGCCG